jgi:two-component system, NarL family, sensor histidine kinase DesK
MSEWLQRLRVQPPPDKVGTAWPHSVWLLYLGLLFLPANWHAQSLAWLWAALISLPVFLALYLRFLVLRWQPGLTLVAATALVCYAVEPFNGFANTYLAFAAAFAPLALPGFIRPLLLTAALLAILSLEVLLLGQPPLIIAISVLVCTPCCVGNAFAIQYRRRNAALRLSQEEVRRLAAVAERERIGRDLHDLLGHTLSLIAIKGELAGKLLERDAQGAAHEIADVTHIAREALGQVRAAVTGMRAAALAGELASARVLLESCGVELTCREDTPALPPGVETALAMIVREAATNIQRHAGATRASVEISAAAAANGAAVALRVSDNGCGGAAARGNGLAGISERVRSLGGTFEIRSPPGAGTVLLAQLPLAEAQLAP